jgi:chemotaxis protein methyltransferase CheR
MFGFFKKKKIKNIQVDEKHPTLASYSFDDVTAIANYFKEQTGINFDTQLTILKNKMSAFCSKKGHKSFDECLNLMQTDSLSKQELIDYLTVNETYFNREYTQLEKLVEEVRTTHHSIRILCAPCSSGEEVYSIVIALLEANISASRFSILGIDINEQIIEKAKKATYNPRNVQNLSPKLIEKYFSIDGSTYILKDFLKDSVEFKKINIFDENFVNLGKFDFVFSRNMLIYFDKETKLRAKAILQSMLKEQEREVFFGHADLF